MNKKSKEKEPQTWFRALTVQGIPGQLQTSLRRYVPDDTTGTMRAKKVAACLFWISSTPMADIEKALTQHGGGYDGAAGPVRAVSARTCDLLPAVARVVRFLHPEMALDERVARLLVRLELGAPSAAVAIARHTGANLSRSDYLDLVKANLVTPDAIEGATDEAILACLDGERDKLQVVREAAKASRNEPTNEPAPELPGYAA